MPSAEFEAAAKWLTTSPSASGQSNAIKLEIYGLYKNITISPQPKPGSRPGIFDWTGGAKWDAWDATGKRYTSSTDAEARYIEIAKSLGFPGLSLPDPSTIPSSSSQPSTSVSKEEVTVHDFIISSPKKEDEIDFDNLSDDDEAGAPSPTTGGGGGMGIKVSQVEIPEEEIEARTGEGMVRGLHEMAIDGDVEGVKRLLAESGVSLDEKDEYGFTPLHLAADRGHVEIVRCLKQGGAKLDIRTVPVEEGEEGETALDLARVSGHQDIVQLLSSS